MRGHYLFKHAALLEVVLGAGNWLCDKYAITRVEASVKFQEPI